MISFCFFLLLFPFLVHPESFDLSVSRGEVCRYDPISLDASFDFAKNEFPDNHFWLGLFIEGGGGATGCTTCHPRSLHNQPIYGYAGDFVPTFKKF